MVHYTCDYCQRALDPAHETRYVVRLELYAAPDSEDLGLDEDRDHLEEIQEMLEQAEMAAIPVAEEVYHQARFDLCSVCRERFLRNPLGRRPTAEFNFSNN